MTVDTAIDKMLISAYEFTDSALKRLPITLLIALSPGVCIGILMFRNAAPEFQMTNEMPGYLLPRMMPTTTGITIASLAVILATYLVISIFRKRSGQIPVLDTVATLNRFATILLTLPLFLSLGIDTLPAEHPFVAIVISLVIASIVGGYTYRFPAISMRIPLWSQQHSITIAIAILCLARLIRIATGTGHVLPSIWLALGAVPVFLLSRHHIKQIWIGAAIVAVYLLYPGIHGMVISDLHSLSIAGPLMLWSLYFIEVRKFGLYFVSLGVLLFVRSDLSLAMFFVGLYIFSREKDLRIGPAAIGICVVYFVVSRLFVTSWEGVADYNNFFNALQVQNYPPAMSFAITAMTNPMFLIKHGMLEYKVVYLLLMLAPVMMLPLLGGQRLITCGYGFLLTSLVSRRSVCDIESEFTTLLYPFFFAIVPAVLPKIGEYRFVSWFRLDSERLVMAMTAALLATAICFSYCYGGIPGYKAPDSDNETSSVGAAALMNMRKMHNQSVTKKHKHFQRRFHEI
jgi:hypothetical protein